MSKSRGNVVDPDEQVRTYGADVVRAYLMFGYQWSEGGPWNAENIQGVVRWLDRLWAVALPPRGRKKAVNGHEAEQRELRRTRHPAGKRRSEPRADHSGSAR